MTEFFFFNEGKMQLGTGSILGFNLDTEIGLRIDIRQIYAIYNALSDELIAQKDTLVDAENGDQLGASLIYEREGVITEDKMSMKLRCLYTA